MLSDVSCMLLDVVVCLMLCISAVYDVCDVVTHRVVMTCCMLFVVSN